jgi:outer membrane biosynthesis protein TonB
VNADHARAIAKTGEAVAAFRLSEPSLKEPPVGTRLVPEEEFALVDALLAEAMDLVHDQAVAGERGGELTPAQAAYAQAMAWKAALNSKLQSEGRPLKAEATTKKSGNEIGAGADPRPMCGGHVVTEPGPDFPPFKQLYERIGAVVLKLLTDEAGKVVRVQVAGTVGGKAFVNAVVDAARQWYFAPDGTPAPGCRMAMESFATVQFVLD